MQKLFNYNNKIYQEDYCAKIVDDSSFIILVKLTGVQIKL